jgi:hypothetical protein
LSACVVAPNTSAGSLMSCRLRARKCSGIGRPSAGNMARRNCCVDSFDRSDSGRSIDLIAAMVRPGRFRAKRAAMDLQRSWHRDPRQRAIPQRQRTAATFEEIAAPSWTQPDHNRELKTTSTVRQWPTFPPHRATISTRLCSPGGQANDGSPLLLRGRF